MDEARLRGEETSLNPLGLVEALIGAIQHAESLAGRDSPEESRIIQFTTVMRKIIHHLMATGRGTRDLCGPSGLTTEEFVEA
eukprot:scaffold167312_cov20-Prasinocladus_malaysianus.AAC.1